MRTFLRGKVTLLFMVLGMLLAIPAVALADQIVGDADVVDANIQGSENLGTVAPGATVSPNPQVGFWLECNGSNHLNPGQTVNLTFGSASWSRVGGGSFSGHSATATPTSLTAPSTWPSDTTNCNAAGNPAPFEGSGESTATITAPTTPGTYNVVLSYNKNIGSPDITGQTQVTFTLTVPSDTTGPVITKTVTGTLGDNDWYTSNVNVDWTVSDPESAISSQSGCADFSVTSDQNAQTYTCTATSAGGTSSQSVTIKRDATNPTITGDASPDANTNGWNNESVTVSYTCGDNLSGVASCASDDLLDTEGANQSASGTATDEAGNTASTTVSGINIDKTKPEINASAKTLPGGATYTGGWTNKDVEVSFSCTDALSGTDTNTVAGATKSASGADQSVTNTGTCTDEAGNTADSKTFSDIDIDKELPTITGSRSPGANTDGWTNQNVAVSFQCDDQPALSGIASCVGNDTVTTEGANQSRTGTATDNAGNTNSATVSNINIDKTAPTVDVTGVTNGTSYTLGSVPAAGCSTSDDLSGVKTNASLNVTGGPVGSITATCSGASDKAGNTGSKSVTYSVIYNWSGFFSPVDNLPVLNLVKGGSSVPLKFNLGGNQGMGILAAGYPKSSVIPCDSTAEVDAIETVATAGSSGLNFDSTTNQYNYIWKTDKAWTSGCRQVEVKLIDGTSHRANFKFSK